MVRSGGSNRIFANVRTKQKQSTATKASTALNGTSALWFCHSIGDVSKPQKGRVPVNSVPCPVRDSLSLGTVLSILCKCYCDSSVAHAPLPLRRTGKTRPSPPWSSATQTPSSTGRSRSRRRSLPPRRRTVSERTAGGAVAVAARVPFGRRFRWRLTGTGQTDNFCLQLSVAV